MQVTATSPAGADWHHTAGPLPICREYLKAYLVQLAVISNHQNGRDTHIRQVKIFGPREDNVKAMLAHDIGFTTPDVLQYMAVR